jgi:hypothetical protein
MSFGSGLDMESKSELYIKASPSIPLLLLQFSNALAAGAAAHLTCRHHGPDGS